MSAAELDRSSGARTYDSTLRWHVPSHSNPHETYLVDLASFNGNGECQCKNFETRRRPFLVRGWTAARALEAGLPDVNVRKIELEPGQRPEDALRCKHIREVIPLYAQLFIDAQIAAEKAHAASSR